MIYKTITWPFGSLSRRIILWIPVFALVDYIVTPFQLLDLSRSLRFWASWSFAGHAVLLALTVIFSILPVVQKRIQKYTLHHHHRTL